MTYIQLAYGDLILPALLVVMDGALSLVLSLKLERQLAVATVRMVLQLVLVGYVLTFLFAAVSPLWTALAALIMVLFASREIVARQKRRLAGIWSYGLGAGCTLLAVRNERGTGCFHVLDRVLTSGILFPGQPLSCDLAQIVVAQCGL